MIEDWLLVAIVVIAATDTRAGRRVLLFGLPGRFGKASAVGPAPAMMPSPEGLLAGLIEVAGAVARFERTVEAHAAEPGFCPHAAADKTPTGPGSDHRLIPKSARQMPCGHRPGCRRQMPTATGVDRFSTVIVLVDPYGSDSMPPGIMWSDLVAQSGPRAFFTRRGASEGRWSPSAAVWCRPGMVADWRGVSSDHFLCGETEEPLAAAGWSRQVRECQTPHGANSSRLRLRRSNSDCSWLLLSPGRGPPDAADGALSRLSRRSRRPRQGPVAGSGW